MNFSQGGWKALHIPYRLAEGMSLHFFVMWFFAINGILYVAYTIISGEWRELVPNRRSFIEAIQVTLHDLHLRKEAPPQTKYNGAQRIAYTSIVVMGLGSLLTGMAIYKPVQFAWLAAIFGGYEMARFFHFWLTVGYVLFFVVHIAQVVRTGWNNFRSMVIGAELEEVPHE
jgi:thiosulfate reductase cytochrome b subunit